MVETTSLFTCGEERSVVLLGLSMLEITKMDYFNSKTGVGRRL